MHLKIHRKSHKRVLFFAEAVTLAHVTRPFALAQCLDAREYEVHFACSRFDDFIFLDSHFLKYPIFSISPERFRRNLAIGRPLYDFKTLERYVEEEVTLIGKIKPSVVVGDFRLSLAISCTLSNVPFVNITNAHWSPRAPLPPSPPEHRVVRLLGTRLASRIFSRIWPFIARLHAMPYDAVRKKYGCAPYRDLREHYTRGDITGFADPPTLIPLPRLQINERYIGPVLWSAPKPLPYRMRSLSAVGRRLVYVTMGSSGSDRSLPLIIKALRDLDFFLIVSTAGRRCHESRDDPQVTWMPYVDGALAARLSDFVVCNGGSATVYQALSEGKPVLGIPENMDQVFTMSYVQRYGAGILLSHRNVHTGAIQSAASRLLSSDMQAKALQLSREIAAHDYRKVFPELLLHL